MKKHVIFGGFDYAVKWEMNQDAIYKGIEYFVETDENWIGKTYLGKSIYGIEKLKEDRENIFVLIGSVVHHTELELILKELGYQEGVDYEWALGWTGDEQCGPLWYVKEWDDSQNLAGQQAAIRGEVSNVKYNVVSKMIPEKCTTVIDLGAASGMLEKYLNKNVTFIPVDYMKIRDDEVICDFNKYEFPDIDENKKNCCIIMCGIIQSVKDWKWLLRKSGELADTIIISHNDIVRVNRDFRREKLTWNNAVFNHQIVLEMQKIGYKMVEAYDFQLRVVLMRFDKVGE